MNTTDRFLERINSFGTQPLDPASLHQVKRCLLDYSGVLFAGRRLLGDRLSALTSSGVCGRGAYEAAMLNGFAAHVIELDDGHRFGAPHLEAVIISAMLGVAKKESISFERFVNGILIGYEATIRLSASMQPGLKMKGFHATGVCGAIGVACAAGYALGLNDTQMKGAFSAAASSAAGILQVLDDNSELKPYNVVNAIQSGLTAVCLSKCGFRGPDDVLGGKRGYLRAHTDQVDLETLLGANERPAIFQIYVKPYASCRHSHAAVECALRMRGKSTFSAEEIDTVEVQTYRLGILAHDQTVIESVSSAKMSTPYSVAAALVFGSCGPEAFSEQAIRMPAVQSLTQKVRVVENERLTAVCPEKRGAIVTITLNDGSTLTEEVEYPLGEPENPMTDAQLEEKYTSLMTFAGVMADEIERIKSMIWDIEHSYEDLINSI
ncbi:MAG: MmgE/PrpD family protein [Clostridia bacterium]|nr:MmgE/PrpD family protein [Clostridia bacterium]